MAHVHLTTFNHTDPPHSIVDQIRFLKFLFRYLKIPFSWGPEFRGSALNFVIENIKSAEANIIREFNRVTGKRIGMIITEHALVGDQGVSFNTISLSQADAGDDYMEPATARERFSYLMDSLEITRKVYTMGELPKLDFFNALEIRMDKLPIMSPPVISTFGRDAARRPRRYDLVFTGGRTRFRDDVVSLLANRYRVIRMETQPGEYSRGKLYRNGLLVLNIPQNARWTWSSPMRILAGLAYGRLTVSLFTTPTNEIDKFAFHVPGPEIVEPIREILDQTTERIEANVIAEYNALTSDHSRWMLLRRDLHDWAVEEGLD